MVGYELIREGLRVREIGSQNAVGKAQPLLAVILVTLHVAPPGQSGLKKKERRKMSTIEII